jgi:tRNA(Ile)-lysidine synthase
MALLQILHALAPAHGWRLAIAHLNHRLRGRASDADERLVRNTAERLGVQCKVDAADIQHIAREQKISIEMAARKARHTFLAVAAGATRSTVVAMAHHADDQVEQFFLRLLRGSGADGLAGMKWSAPLPADGRLRLIRPLLDVGKSELTGFASAEGIAFRVDASNGSSDFLRNRIRHELLPLLARRFQPAIAKVILRQMEILGAEASFLDDAARNWLSTTRIIPFECLSIAVQRRVIQTEAYALGANLDFELIEKLRLKKDSSISAAATLALTRDREGRLHRVVAASLAFQQEENAVELAPQGSEGCFHGLEWAAKIERWQHRRLPSRRPFNEWFDADRVGASVVLRHWRRGDRFQPSGMARPVKLQDLFTNQKIPALERRQRVIAATRSGEIWWVEGLRIADPFKIQPHTTRAMQWQWRRNPAG